MVTTSSGPQAPSGLQAVAHSGYQVNLSWTDASDDETAFRVERSTDGINFMLLGTPDANTRSWSDLTVRSGTNYHYRVAAQNDDGISAYSNVAIVATPAVVPRPPTGLEASAISRSQISLSWRDNSDNEDGFRIERARDGADFVEIASVGPDISSYLDLPADSTSFQYRVRAFNGIGTSSPSNAAVVTTAVPLPQTPGNPVATLSGGQVTLNWSDASDNELGFRIERSENGFNHVVIATLGANATSYVDSTVKLGTNYYYLIRAFNEAGPGGAVAASVSIPAVLLQTPGGLTATAITSQQVNLEWVDNSSGESGFHIERSTGGGAYVVIGNAGANFRNFYDVTTSATTTYTYRIAAFDMFGSSAYSNFATVTTPAVIPPAPVAVTAVNIRKKARVEWVMNGSPLPQAFEVRRETYKKGAWRYAAVVASTPGSTFLLVDASGKGTFRYSVRACNPSGCSAYVESAAVKVTK
jgi:titin